GFDLCGCARGLVHGQVDSRPGSGGGAALALPAQAPCRTLTIFSVGISGLPTATIVRRLTIAQPTMSQNDITFAKRAPGQRDESAFRSLVRTFGLLKRVMEPYFAQFGISGSQWSVLRTLHRCREDGEAELRLSELGNRLIVRPASVTGVVDRLERMGLVDRVIAPDDQR